MPGARAPDSVSGQIRLLTAVAAIMVVYIHATTIGYAGLGWQAPHAAIQGYLSHNLFHVCLPIFFFCSGFLLVVGVNSVGDIVTKLRRRVRSLIVPYLLWSALWLTVLLASRPFFALDFGKYSDLQGLSAWLGAVFLDPVAGQLWFLRDLIVLMALSPLFLLLRRLPSLLLLAAAYVAWLWRPTPTVISARAGWWEAVSTEALVWFLAGLMASRFLDLDWLGRVLERRHAVLTIVTGAAYLLLPLGNGNGFVPDSAIFGLCITLGFVFLSSLYPWVKRLAHSPVTARFSSFTFLMFVAHYPTSKALILIALSVLGRSPEAALVVYLTVPLVVIAGVIVVLSSFARVWPGAVLALNGFRPFHPFLRATSLG